MEAKVTISDQALRRQILGVTAAGATSIST